ncbi:hypothetical protein Csa_017406 [Cucumis sativus]|uniref:Uncharacterized protein n=1 Tax=Cucumis sativus TaxID=3659 RepID=A0A0A0LDG4_CUCSA|nr:hypothetical protein Csa_017406 [Cucumis sativus]
MVVKLVVRELLLEVVVELEIDHQINWLRESVVVVGRVKGVSGVGRRKVVIKGAKLVVEVVHAKVVTGIIIEVIVGA